MRINGLLEGEGGVLSVDIVFLSTVTRCKESGVVLFEYSRISVYTSTMSISRVSVSVKAIINNQGMDIFWGMPGYCAGSYSRSKTGKGVELRSSSAI